MATSLGCATGTSSPRSASFTSCERLGWALYVLAGYRDRGDSREDQIRWANAAIEADAPRKTTLLLIDRIHRERLSALPLGVDIIRRCDPEPSRAVVSKRATR